MLDRAVPRDGRRIPGAVYVQGDIADQDLLALVLSCHRFDGVIHLAGDKSAEDSVHHPIRYFHNNVAGSLRLFEAVVQHGVQVFVFSSSCAVYGRPEQVPVTEESAVKPENPYGESKYLVERINRS